MQPAAAHLTVAAATGPAPVGGPVSAEHVAAVYRHAVLAGGLAAPETTAAQTQLPVPRVVAATDQLLADRLLRHDPGRGRLVAVDPEIAAAALVGPLEREIGRQRERIARIRERADSFRDDFADAARPVGRSPIEQHHGAAQVEALVAAAVARGTREVLVLEAGTRSEDLGRLLELCAPLLERGVAVRVLCLHRSRAELALRRPLERIAAAGAQVRTASSVPRSAVVVDAGTAILLGDDPEAPQAVHLRDGGPVVAFLLDLFTELWDGASALDPAATGYGEAAGDLQRSILELMAQGVTDEVVARKLGMSVRSCRRHIAGLLAELGAVSRFQAGVAAGRGRLVDLPLVDVP